MLTGKSSLPTVVKFLHSFPFSFPFLSLSPIRSLFYIYNMNPDVASYLSKAPAGQQSILQLLRRMMLEEIPGLTENYKWSRPVYSKGKDLVYLKTAKTYVTLGFFGTALLEDPAGLLEGTGKDMRHVKIRNVDDVNEQQFREWFRVLGK